MSERKLNFRFNTFVSGNGEDGTFDQNGHRQLIAPLFRLIKNNDGITTCYVYQAGIEVEYLDYMTDQEAVVKIVQEAVKWAKDQEGFFPLRGDKTPRVTLDSKPQTPDPYQTIEVRFNSHLTVFQVDTAEAGFDTAAFRELVGSLANELTNTEGVVRYELYLGGAALKFDTRLTTKEAIEAHMREVFFTAAADSINGVGEAEFFPYLTPDKGMVLTFS
jgi:quinol monooxygenase YgiN